MRTWSSRIGMKLALYLVVTLVGLSLITGILFTVLMRSHTVSVYKEDLERRAIKVAETLSEFERSFDMGRMRMGGPGGGYGVFVRFIGEITGVDVWVIDQNGELIVSNLESSGQKISMDEMRQKASGILEQVFAGETVFSEAFTPFLKDASLTVGTPVHDSDGLIIGAVFLHAPIDSMDDALWQGIRLMVMSIVAAMALALCISLYLSFLFTEPLRIMKNQSLNMAEGRFDDYNHIHQKDEIGELAETLNVLGGQLEEAENMSRRTEQMRRDFVANISHELRTPITSIRCSLEAINDGVVDEPGAVAAYHGQMLGEIVHLQRLVGDLLELSKLQNADFPIQYENVLLQEIIESALQGIRVIAIQKQVDVVASHANVTVSQAEDSIMGDFGRLRQMVTILLDNAVKYSDSGGTVTMRYNDGVLCIEDYGVGIAPDDLDHVFEKFYKSKDETNSNGTGLGLAIAKQIADRHDVGIRVESQPGQGTRFFVDFRKAMI